MHVTFDQNSRVHYELRNRVQCVVQSHTPESKFCTVPSVTVLDRF